jgi:hypothetical protein
MAQKIFMTKSGKATIICPECGKVKQMDVSKFTDVNKSVNLKVTCACGHRFPIMLERRLHIRKNVDLKGHMVVKHKSYGIKVLDMSRLGLKIRIEKALDIQKGEKILINFILDDPGESRVEKEVLVKKVSGTDIGVEFISQDHYDKFGPYLLFHFR